MAILILTAILLISNLIDFYIESKKYECTI